MSLLDFIFNAGGNQDNRNNYPASEPPKPSFSNQGRAPSVASSVASSAKTVTPLWRDELGLDKNYNVPTYKKIQEPDFFSSLFLGCFGEDRKPKRNPSSETKPKKEVNPTPLVRPPYYSAWM